MTAWSELSGFKRDLLISVGILNRDADRRAFGLAVIDTVGGRFGHSDKCRATYYQALIDLRDADLVEVDRFDPDGRRKVFQLTPEAVRMLDDERSALEASAGGLVA